MRRRRGVAELRTALEEILRAEELDASRVRAQMRLGGGVLHSTTRQGRRTHHPSAGEPVGVTLEALLGQKLCEEGCDWSTLEILNFANVRAVDVRALRAQLERVRTPLGPDARLTECRALMESLVALGECGLLGEAGEASVWHAVQDSVRGLLSAGLGAELERELVEELLRRCRGGKPAAVLTTVLTRGGVDGVDDPYEPSPRATRAERRTLRTLLEAPSSVLVRVGVPHRFARPLVWLLLKNSPQVGEALLVSRALLAWLLVGEPGVRVLDASAPLGEAPEASLLEAVGVLYAPLGAGALTTLSTTLDVARAL